MYFHKLVCALFFVSVLSACPNEQLFMSLEEMDVGALAFQKGAVGKAIDHFDKAARIYPENHAAWYYLGYAYVDQKDFQKASEALGEAVKYKKDESMYQMLFGIALYESNNKSMAASYLEKAIELEPRLYRAYWFLGRIHDEAEEPERAAQLWSRSAVMNPQWGESFISLGQLYLRWDLLDEAISVLEQAKMHVDPEFLPDVFYYLGLAYDSQKNWQQAIDAYSQAIEKAKLISKDNIEARFQRGVASFKLGDYDNAKADLEAVAKGSADGFTKQEANNLIMKMAVQ